MENQNSNENAFTGRIIKQAINNWDGQIKRVTDYFNKYDNDLYLKEIAPGRNRAIYLLGHLIAVHDRMLPLLGKGEKQYPELEPLFVSNPDKAFDSIPSLDELKKIWETQDKHISGIFNKMEPEEWMDRHTTISAEDFVNEPLRNKLSILLSRTNHIGYHMGQLALLKGEEVAA